MDLLQEYKELYYKEMEFSNKLSEKINICITFLTILGSGQVLLWTQSLEFEISVYTSIYFVMCCISTGLFITCLFKFYKAYSGYKTQYFPIKAMARAVKETYYIANKKEAADKHVYDMFCERYINDAIHNREVNKEKNNNHKVLISWICRAFVFLIISYTIGICINHYESKIVDNVQKVYIEGVNYDVFERE